MSAAVARRIPAAAWALGAGVTIVAAWRIVTLATDPGVQPGAQLKRAERALAEGRLDDAARHAREQLAATPFDGRPHRVLAQVAAAGDDRDAVHRFAELAVRHAPRDVVGRALAAQSALERSDWAAALNHYDRLLRVRPGLSAEVFPILGAMAEPPDVRAELVRTLEGEPAWRLAFLRQFARTAPDPRPLFRDLRTASPLAPEEARAYVGRYVADRRWGEAFVAWAEPLDTEQILRLTTPVNGSFEETLELGPPFDWQIDRVAGVEAGIRRLPDGEGRALRVEFVGRRAAFNHVRQLLLLTPGDYTLGWRQRLQGLEAARGLRWTLTCADDPKTVIFSTTSVTGSAPWVSLSAEFTVPDGCRAQWLILELEARIAAETLATGAAWFDDVRVTRARGS